MPPDSYKVEVLYYLNPHLIWVEVRDPAIVFDEHDIKFEQVGIYGMLPLETTIELDDHKISVHSCKEWVPAAATLMREFLAEEENVWFTPMHLDRRSSIFDDNIHKFGDIFIEKKNGKTRSMSKVLRNSGFATYDACLFHQYLSLGKINTKLNIIETQNVLTELKKYFINKNVPRKKWESPIESQTSVFRVSYEIEEALTATNLDKHNKHIKTILENKNRDLELCKGVDEPSVGRGSTRKLKEKKKQSPVEKKVEHINNKKAKNDSIAFKDNKNNEHEKVFEDTKIFLEANSSPCTMKISSKADAHKAQILKKVMSKTAKKVSKQDKLLNRLIESKDNIVETDKINVEAASAKPVQDLLHEDNDHIVHNTPITKNQENKIKDIDTMPEQELSVKTQNTVASTLKENQIELNEANKGNHHHHNHHHHRRSSRGKGNKKVAKPEVNTSTLELQKPLTQSKHGARTRSTSPQQRLAYPPQKTNRDQEKKSRRIPEIPNVSEACSTNTPVSEHMVKKIMSTFKLSDSKHCDMIQNALRKCKDGGKNNSDAVAALMECRNKIIAEIKELNNPNNTYNIDLDLPLSQSLSKSKFKIKGKKQNVNNGKGKVAFGPPGLLDIGTLNRVPPVVLYGEGNPNNDGQTTEVIVNRGVVDGDEDSIVSSGLEEIPVPSCSYINKLKAENVTPQEKRISIKRIEKRQEKDTSSSSSSLWEKRLKLQKEISKYKRCASQTSDTTNKDSSNPEEKSQPKNFTKQTTEEDSDDSISELVEKLGIGYYSNNISTVNKADKNVEYTREQVAIKANPFQNYDISLSVFVDKLVTPIMMVHSKMNKRFVPTCNIRDIHFTDHIRLVLKNLRVEHPMMMQSISWNAILRGYSVLMIGSASSGKTMGYLPSVCRLVTDFHQSDSNCDSLGPFCIIVCATSQSVSEIERIAKMLVGCEEKVVSCYYGHDELAIATSLLNGCDLLITTAPSLVRLLQMNDLGVDLQRLATFVLDDCERLSEVYSNELKFCLYKIQEMLKSRVNKELSVQYVIASRIWCDFMEPFAKKAPDTVVCIGAFQECVLYAKANMTVSYVKKENKLNHLMEFLEDIDPCKRTVVVCDSDEEIDYLFKAIQTTKYFVFAANSNMTVQSLYSLSKDWEEFKDPLMAPVLICRDSNLYHMNVENSNYLVQYSMPALYSVFCRRFSTLNESYPSIFKIDNQNIKILILLEENNVEQFPKIIQFVKRCTNDVPDFLHDICTAVLAEKDVKKAENYAPLCNSLMSLGDCPDLLYCKSRHTILKDYDKPKEWMPLSGVVTFKILHYHSAALYSARLIKNFDAGTHSKYPSSYSHMSLTMGMHYAKQENRILFGVPKVGDICAVALRSNLFSRAQVIKIIDKYERGNPKNILVKLLDEEIMEVTSDTNLYYLPDAFKSQNTYVVHVRLANIQPRDKDIVFSELAKDQLKETIGFKKGLYMKGKIVLTVGSCIFVDTLEACEDLKSLNETVVICNVKRELLEKHAEVNPNHLSKIEELCKRAELELKPIEKKENQTVSLVKVEPKISWAHLEEDMVMVDFGIVENPDILFVRLTKFEDCMQILVTDIQKYVANNIIKIEKFEKGDIVLAEYPDDCMYERARIDEIEDEKIKCFFVDQGEWRHLTKDKFMPISQTLITQLPFQAIECRLVGIKPPGDYWTDFSTNWLFDKCAETESGATKQLFVKYFTKEPAEYTGGHKYGVVVIDTYGNEDLILNQLMIDLNLATEVEHEIKFLNISKCKNEVEAKSDDVEEDDDSWEKVSKHSTTSGSTPIETTTVMLSQPLRSVPLVGTDEDSDDSEKWNINMTDDMAEMFKPFIEASTQEQTNLPAIESNKTEMIEDLSSLSINIKECSREFQRVKISPDSSKELDSDDLSSPETGQSTIETSEKTTEAVPLDECQLRKPKLNWRQTKTNVTIKIQLIGVDKYDLNIQDRSLTFTATVNDTDFGFDFEFYGVIDKKTAIHSNKGQYILIKFNKIMHKNWLTLTKDGGLRKWIVYDVDSIDTSSDEEEVVHDNLYNMVKNINNNSESDSEVYLNYRTMDDVN